MDSDFQHRGPRSYFEWGLVEFVTGCTSARRGSTEQLRRGTLEYLLLTGKEEAAFPGVGDFPRAWVKVRDTQFLLSRISGTC